MTPAEQALLETLEIPTYKGRQLLAQRVKKREHPDGTDYYAITGTSGWTAGCSREVYDLLPEGKPYILETIQGSWITGWLIDGKWYDRQSDQDRQRAHAAFLADMDRRHRDALDANRDDWQRRQDALPSWVRERLETFHTRGGETFALDGWGYELVVAELAVEYAAMGDVILDKDEFSVEDSDEIKRIAREQGTSGNQHAMALALAKAHLSGASLAGTVSALSPITGDAFYEGVES